jgi:hypothetical protein
VAFNGAVQDSNIRSLCSAAHARWPGCRPAHRWRRGNFDPTELFAWMEKATKSQQNLSRELAFSQFTTRGEPNIDALMIDAGIRARAALHICQTVVGRQRSWTAATIRRHPIRQFFRATTLLATLMA